MSEQVSQLDVLTAKLRSSAPQWKPSRIGEVLVDSTGKIIGEVSWAALSGGGYHAISQGNFLGRYYTEEDAKRAVEVA